MNSIFKKLGLTHQNPVLILNAPEEYKEIMGAIEAEVHEQVIGKYKFIQIFAKEFDEAKTYASEAIKVLEDDGHLWLCYPKGASKKYKSDINRTKSWDIFAPYDFEPVSQVSIDEDWSAMRFRHVDNIKTMKRKTAATEKGQERIKLK
ncbi:hypothetical protein G9F72_010030 [Clostridium estertheticum]|uniref:DUF3052 domain-containing protein n=1 Tax=Clostridium estertheticum TaxID=238834 RepID=UPI0013E93044|nr:DUF3052 domain-containing protein [Clostridium estertheticum]MBZ9686664.1 hypothetical protein [Clostridium estertheticum]